MRLLLTGMARATACKVTMRVMLRLWLLEAILTLRGTTTSTAISSVNIARMSSKRACGKSAAGAGRVSEEGWLICAFIYGCSKRRECQAAADEWLGDAQLFFSPFLRRLGWQTAEQHGGGGGGMLH